MKKITYNTTSASRYVTFLSEQTKKGFIVDKAWVSRNIWYIPVYNLIMRQKDSDIRLNLEIGPIMSRLLPVTPAQQVTMNFVVGPVNSK